MWAPVNAVTKLEFRKRWKISRLAQFLLAYERDSYL
jgi:hypothetical protein